MLGWFGSDIVDAAEDVASSAVDAIPGLKDFAGTVVGKVVLTAISGGLYAAAAPTLGPQLAAITFALPGLARGESFAKAWTQGFVERVTALIKYFVSVGIPDDLASSEAGNIAQAAFDKLNVYAAQFKIDGLDIHALARLAGVREDFAAQYLAQATGDLSFVTDHTFDPATGVMLPDAPTIQDKLRQLAQQQVAHAQEVARIAPAAATSTLARGQAAQTAVHALAFGPVAGGVLARAAVQAPATRAVAPADAPRSTSGQDFALVAIGAIALGALYWWYRS
jgi:hypothetical protein